MKKVLTFVAVLAMTAFVASCGDDSAQRIADSTRIADSMKAVEDAAKHTADSIHMADSMKMAAEAAEMKRKADSAHMADSIANSKKGGKPKTIEQKVKEEAKKVTSGRG